MRWMVLLVTLVSVFSRAADGDGSEWAGNLEMNGYSLRNYQNFAKEWTLVTVRYRQDSGEFRFTYANPSALKALKSGKPYPEGAVFAKTAYLLGHDPAFPSSMVPDKIARYQLMVKNAKFKETDGWAYALFDSTGKTFPGEPRAVSYACNACHKIVLNKGSVFSELVNKEISFFSKPVEAKVMSPLNLPAFEGLETSKLPEKIRSKLPGKVKTVRSVIGDLKKFLFEGTLDEIKPFLAKESLRSSQPAVLFNEKGEMFSLVFKDDQAKSECVSPSGKAFAMVAITSIPASGTTHPYAQLANIQDGSSVRTFCFVD